MKITVEMTLEEYQTLKTASDRGKHVLHEMQRIADMFAAPNCDVCNEMRGIAIRSFSNPKLARG